MNNKIKIGEPIRVYFNNSTGSHSLCILNASYKFMFCACEDDFRFNGYTIRRFEDVDEVISNTKYQEIVKAEKIFDNIQVPDIKINSWKDIFNSLYDLNENIIVESEELDDNSFYVGRIEKVMDYGVTFRCFDSNAQWDKEAHVINYFHITSVTFKSSYINAYSKYVND